MGEYDRRIAFRNNKLVNPREISKNFGSHIGTLEGDVEETFGLIVYRSACVGVVKKIDRLFGLIRFLQTEHIKILNEILFSGFIEFNARAFGSGIYSNKTFEKLTPNMYTYFNLIKELEDYNKKIAA